MEPEPQKKEYGYKTHEIVILIFLTLFFCPLGILYAAWMIGKKKGLFLGLGCLSIPVLLVLFYIWAVSISDSGEHQDKVD